MKQKHSKFQPKRLKQARTAKMFNMRELAEVTGLTRQAISQFEKGHAAPSPERLRILADKLDVDETYFLRPLSSIELNQESPPSFRSLASSSNKARLQAESGLERMVFVAAEMTQYVRLPPVKIPHFEISDFVDLSEGDIEDFANRTRRELGIGAGPISNLTLLLENHGVVIGSASMQAKLDGLSAWFDGRPFILISSRGTGVRHRFDVAHELAHLVLHKNLMNEEELEDKKTHKVIENQAHYFAGCFLLPESTFAAEVYGTDFDSLVRLKERWKVSIQAIIMRLFSLSIISVNQKQRLFQALAVRNARRHEPLDDVIRRENPRMFSRIVELLSAEGIMNPSELRAQLGLSAEYLAQLMSISSTSFEKAELPNNVIALRK